MKNSIISKPNINIIKGVKSCNFKELPILESRVGSGRVGQCAAAIIRTTRTATKDDGLKSFCSE